MINSNEWNPVRIPVKLVGDHWEYFYSGDRLPLKDGTVGDLIVSKSAIEDKKFLAQIKKASKHKFLPQGVSLLVALTIKPEKKLDSDLEELLIDDPKHEKYPLSNDYFHTARSPLTRFVEIKIGGPTKWQQEMFPKEEGGIWLQLEGSMPKGITSSTVDLPKGITDESVESLNHAFTLLSERFEPWRKSHTGNIYDRMLYQEKNEKWYPLNVLRNAAIAEEEHQLIRERWAEIAKLLGLSPNI